MLENKIGHKRKKIKSYEIKVFSMQSMIQELSLGRKLLETCGGRSLRESLSVIKHDQ